jgi:hypothetical protein
MIILIWTGAAYSQETDEVKLQEFISKYFTAGSQFYNAKDEMYREIRTLSPVNKTAIYRLIRKNELELYKSIKGETDKEYLKGKQLDEIFTIGEDISLKEKGVYLSDLSDEELKAVVKEAVRQYPGELIIDDWKVMREH